MPVVKDAMKNRIRWNDFADEYHKLHEKPQNIDEFHWGYWSVPEKEINVFGNLKSKKVLELGCGEGLQSISIYRNGGIPFGIDNSMEMLKYAKINQEEYGAEFPLFLSSADELTFENGEFDIVFCDHGAMSFSESRVTLTEVNRVLKNEGYFIFNMASPLHEICYDTKNEQTNDMLHQNYFDLGRIEDDGFVYYQHTYGEWIRLFRETGFQIIDLIELRPPFKSKTLSGLHKWAEKWPAENLWKLQKTSSPGAKPE